MTIGRVRVLVVDEDDKGLAAMAVMLESLGYEALTATSGDEALAMLQHQSIQVLMTEVVLTGDISGPDLARLAKEMNPAIAIVYTTRYSPMLLLDSEAPRDGPLIRKQWDEGELRTEVCKALATAAAAC